VCRSDQHRSGLGVSVRLSFAHNILFDYAAARLWLRDLPPAVIAELERPDQQDLVLFARPSIVLLFQGLWHTSQAPDRGDFWNAALALSGSGLRLAGKIIAAGVAAAEFRRVSDIALLLARVETEGGQGPAANLLKHVVTAAMTRFGTGEGHIRWSGEGSPEWLGLALELTRRASGALSWQARLILTLVQRNPGQPMTPQQSEWANRAARALLEVELQRGSRGPAVTTAVAVACQTSAAEPEATIRAIRPVLDRAHQDDWHDLLEPIAEQFKHVATANPVFAARVIRSVFSKDYSRDDQIPPRDRIMPLTFNKHDSMETVRRDLAKSVLEMLEGGNLVAVHLHCCSSRHRFATATETTGLAPHASLWLVARLRYIATTATCGGTGPTPPTKCGARCLRRSKRCSCRPREVVLRREEAPTLLSCRRFWRLLLVEPGWR
jgi:hypothetical protein